MTESVVKHDKVGPVKIDQLVDIVLSQKIKIFLHYIRLLQLSSSFVFIFPDRFHPITMRQ